MKRLFLCLGVCLINALTALTPSCITQEHQKILEKEFSYLFSKCLGYTLIGEKPMSLEYLGDRPWEQESNAEMVIEYLYRIFDSSDTFVFVHYSQGSYRELILVHKPSLEKLVEKEQEFLNSRLKRHVTIDWIISSLKQSNCAIDAFDGDSIALGVLLGYGETNSFFFRRKTDLGDYLKKRPFFECEKYVSKSLSAPDDTFYRVKPPEINYAFNSYEEEWKFISQNDAPEPERVEVPYLFQPIWCVSRRCKETDLFNDKYSKAREKLAGYFYNKSFVTTVINLSKEKQAPKIIISESSSDEAQIIADAALYYQTSMGPQFVLAGIPTIQDILVRNGLCLPVEPKGQLTLTAAIEKATSGKSEKLNKENRNIRHLSPIPGTYPCGTYPCK